MKWIQKHTDTVIVLGGILTSVFWMNGQLNEIKGEIGILKTEMAIIKTVLIMKEIMPHTLATEG